MDEADLKKELARELRRSVRRLNPVIWELLVSDGEVHSALDCHAEIESAPKAAKREWSEDEKRDWRDELQGLAGSYRRCVRYDELKQEAQERPPSTLENVAMSTADARLRALAEILALDASRLVEVQNLRAELLKGSLLEPVEVSSWIEACAASEGEVDEGVLLRYPRGAIQAPGRLFARPGGALDRLRELADRLAGAYSWLEVDALSFVLSGDTPALAQGTAAIRRRVPYGALGRVVIEADPYAPISEVTKLFMQASTALLGKRPRGLSEKHIALALVGARCAGHLASGGTSVALDSSAGRVPRRVTRIRAVLFEEKGSPPSPRWRGLLEAWNREHPEWAYAKGAPVQQFATDVRVAWEHVTGCRWAPSKDAEDAADARDARS